MEPILAYTINQAVEAGAGSRSAIYEAIARGELKAKKLGRSTRILREDLQAFLRSRPTLDPIAPSKFRDQARKAVGVRNAQAAAQRKPKKPAARQRRRS
jgi:excisionase family DNA binding protein